jgi:hypothetical protein
MLFLGVMCTAASNDHLFAPKWWGLQQQQPQQGQQHSQ